MEYVKKNKIENDTSYGATSTEWTSRTLDFTETNYGIELTYD